MRTFLDWTYRLSGAMAALFLLAICATVMVQVSFNILDNALVSLGYSALGYSLPSYAELTGYFLVAASFLALAYTLRAGGHIRVTLFTRHLKGRVRQVTEMFCATSGFFLAAYFTWHFAWMVHDSWKFNDLSSGTMVIPIWIPQLPMAIGSAILAIALADELCGIFVGNEPSYARGDEGELVANTYDEDPAS